MRNWLMLGFVLFLFVPACKDARRPPALPVVAPPPSAPLANLRVLLAENPSTDVDIILISLDQLEVLWMATDAQGMPVLTGDQLIADVMTFRNDLTETLVEEALGAGPYAGLRLVLDSTPPGGPNSPHTVVIEGQGFPLTVRGVRNPIKLLLPFDLAADQMTELMIDFRKRKSVVKRGKNGEFFFKPKFRLVVPSDCGSISGTVQHAGPGKLEHATVSAQQGGTEVLSARVRKDGRFELGPLEEGTYALVATADGFVPQVETDVEVVRHIDSDGHDFTLMPTGIGSISGTAPLGDEFMVLLRWQGHLLDRTMSDEHDGEFEFEHVPAGLAFDVVLLEDGVEVDAILGVQVTAGQETTGLVLAP
ncbi:MAG: carboxypeptidase regulatory-like domain-containing protein [Planctomycetota bacterium]